MTNSKLISSNLKVFLKDMDDKVLDSQVYRTTKFYEIFEYRKNNKLLSPTSELIENNDLSNEEIIEKIKEESGIELEDNKLLNVLVSLYTTDLSKEELDSLFESSKIYSVLINARKAKSLFNKEDLMNFFDVKEKKFDKWLSPDYEFSVKEVSNIFSKCASI